MRWDNWSGSVTAFPEYIAKPRTASDLRALVEQSAALRVVGAGHSFMPLCETEGALVSLDDYEGAVEIAPDRKSAWVPAGWSLRLLTEKLWDQGLSLINQGDVNPQSLAGAIATGTHGTGAGLGSLSTQACGFEVMLADGRLVTCGPDERPDLFECLRLSLGLFGIVTRIRLTLIPAYHLDERVEKRRLAEIVEAWDDLSGMARHVEFFLFPYADEVLLKTLHPVEVSGERGVADAGDDNGFRRICEAGASDPARIPELQRMIMDRAGRVSPRIGPAWRIFPAERTVRFEEMEYEVPRAEGIETLLDLIDYIRRKALPVLFPIEYRLVAGDDIWMSPFNNGPSAAISFHQYAGLPWEELFAEVEPILRSARGRPHWAKRHGLTRDDIYRLYPRTEEFLALRKVADPTAKFTNAILARHFGIIRPDFA